MAEIVQLKNDNGSAVYPVTMGEAINMNNGKTLDQAFNEAKNQILLDISTKKNELATEVEAKKADFNNLYTDKSELLSSEFTTKTAELQTDFDGKTTALQTDFNSKKTALQTDYNNYSTSLDINNKAGFYKGDNDIQIEYPVGSIVLATTSTGISALNRTTKVYCTSSSSYGFQASDVGASYLPTGSAGARLLNGTWAIHGFHQLVLGENKYLVLVQRIS